VGSTVYSLARAATVAAGGAIAAAAGLASGAAAPPVAATAAASGATLPAAMGMGDFIRGGVTSAMSSNASPPVPPAASSTAPRAPNGPIYRPHGPVQVLSYMAGRTLAMGLVNNAEYKG